MSTILPSHNDSVSAEIEKEGSRSGAAGATLYLFSGLAGVAGLVFACGTADRSMHTKSKPCLIRWTVVHGLWDNL